MCILIYFLQTEDDRQMSSNRPITGKPRSFVNFVAAKQRDMNQKVGINSIFTSMTEFVIGKLSYVGFQISWELVESAIILLYS